ncbi:hypothetical protein [Streptomyces botrytidirepellens]|uniref:hypothetical protein n=1 Tax=Streptomyces botrytidirepellens TaxID=2486417 RepID=UPI000F42B71D|nr:hypothetical protein [Streptomyces botrytidirepellens]
MTTDTPQPPAPHHPRDCGRASWIDVTGPSNGVRALLETPRMPKPRKELIQREIDRVDAVLAHVRTEET